MLERKKKKSKSQECMSDIFNLNGSLFIVISIGYVFIRLFNLITLFSLFYLYFPLWTPLGRNHNVILSMVG